MEQTGFQPEGFSQGGFQAVSSDFSQTGFQPTHPTDAGVNQTGFQQEFSQGGFQIPAAKPKETGKIPPQPTKRIIICCDGTWQSSAHGAQTIPSNVSKISRSIASWYIDENGLMAPQIVYYDSGVGTAMNSVEAFWNGLRGTGLDENVCEAYNFLANNYSPGDELFFFGFSRGAYTVRACAGLVCRVGICDPSAMGQFWEMYANYKAINSTDKIEDSDWVKEVYTDDGVPQKFKVKVKGADWEFEKGSGASWYRNSKKDVKIKVVGVWDTVGSVGYPENIWIDVTEWNKPYGFHNTEIHPQIENAFHALALEERRKSFGPTLWQLPEGSNTNLIQCWFPGVHINVGGGSGDGMRDREEGIGHGARKVRVDGEEQRSKGDLEIMSITTFFWMVDRCNPFLRFNVDHNIIGDYRRALDIIMQRNEKEDPEYKKYGGWGVAPVIDSFSGKMAALGAEVRTPGHYFLGKDHHSHAKDREHHHARTNEYMHPVVHHAREQIGYDPDALKGFVRTPRGPGKGHDWVKTYKTAEPGLVRRGISYLFGSTVQSESEHDVVSIPEFVIPEPGMHENGLYWVPGERALVQLAGDRVGGFIPPEERAKSKALQVDQEGAQFMFKLDQENQGLPELSAWKKHKFTSTNMDYPYDIEWARASNNV